VAGTLAFWGVMALLVGFVAYREAIGFARKNGRTPWDWPPMAWAVVAGALGLLVGGLLLLIARRTTQPVTALPPGRAIPQQGPAPAQAPFGHSILPGS
jgi:hypothetical protein